MLFVSVDSFLTGELGVLQDHSRAATADSYNVCALGSEMHNEFSLVCENSTSLARSWTFNLYL
jgi:hypothetical protein